jgi:HAD superfamily hydrolase (TIGR01509 family)
VLHARAVGDPRVQCVASGSERATVERELVAVGIRQLFGFVVCGEEVERGKPDPEMFLRCADWMGLHPSRCLVFEDSELGIRAARVAGMGWVRVPVRPPG